MARRECSEPDAQDEAYDMPWFVRHTCPTTSEPTPSTTSQEV